MNKFSMLMQHKILILLLLIAPAAYGMSSGDSLPECLMKEIKKEEEDSFGSFKRMVDGIVESAERQKKESVDLLEQSLEGLVERKKLLESEIKEHYFGLINDQNFATLVKVEIHQELHENLQTIRAKDKKISQANHRLIKEVFRKKIADKLKLNQIVDLNFHDKFGETPLNVAIQLKKPLYVWYLVNQGAALDFADKQGVLPLFFALKAQGPTLRLMVRLLTIKKQADKQGIMPNYGVFIEHLNNEVLREK